MTKHTKAYRTIIGDGPLMESIEMGTLPDESFFNHPNSECPVIHIVSSHPLNQVQIYKIRHTLLQDVLYSEYTEQELKDLRND